MSDKPSQSNSGSSSRRPANVVPIELARSRRAAAVSKVSPPQEIIECPVDVGFYPTDIGVVSVDGARYVTSPGCLLAGDNLALLPTLTVSQAILAVERLVRAIRVLSCTVCASSVRSPEPTLPECTHVENVRQ